MLSMQRERERERERDRDRDRVLKQVEWHSCSEIHQLLCAMLDEIITC